MKHIAYTLSAILILFTFCACSTDKGALSSTYDPSQSSAVMTSESIIDESVPLSTELIYSITRIFYTVPKGTFLSLQKKESGAGSSVIMDTILLGPDSKKETDLTADIHKINKTVLCTLSSDGTKILVGFNEDANSASSSDLFGYLKGLTNGASRDYLALLDENGKVLFSCKPTTYCFSDDMNYLAYSDATHHNFLVDIRKSGKLKMLDNTSIYGIQSGYLFGYLNDTLNNIMVQPDTSGAASSAISSTGADNENTQAIWFYDIQGKKMSKIRTNGVVMKIVDSHAILIDLSKLGGTVQTFKYNEFDKENVTFYDFDLKTGNMTKTDKETAESYYKSVSPDKNYSAEKRPLESKDKSATGIHIKNVKTGKMLIYPSDGEGVENIYSDLRWIEKK